MATVSDLIHSSFRLIGAVAAGETLETNELNDALVSLNQMIASWSTEKLSVYAINKETFPLSGTQSYTMGPGGSFATARPVQIIAARATSGSGNYGRHLDIVDADAWTSTVERDGGINLPIKAFVDYAFPLATVWLWPVPAASTQVELYTMMEYTSFPQTPDNPVHSFQPQRLSYTMAGGVGSFTVGPGGQLAGTRPARCDAIAVSFGTYRREVPIINAAAWATLLEPSGQPITVPIQMYVQYTYPMVTINLWPTPGAGGQIEIHSLQAITQFVNLTDTISLPPGYEAALRYNFAIAILPEYPRSQPDPTLPAQAQNYKATLVQLNRANLLPAAQGAAPEPAETTAEPRTMVTQ
jgi:hypothetical protein